MNILKTFLLLGLLTVLMVFIGRMIGGNAGMLVMLAISLGMNFFSFWFSDKMVVRMTGAKPVSRSQVPEIYEMVEELARRAKVPSPKIYMTNDAQPNAFATGRSPSHALVAVTQGLVNLVDKNELRGVLAHEIAHIANRDILISSVAAMMAGVITYAAQIAQWGAIFGSHSDENEGGSPVGTLALAILAPIAALLVQAAVSRSREYQADASGASFARDKDGLSQALQKIEAASSRVPLAHANAATAHLYISNPLNGAGLMSLFSTHPPVKDRVARLRELRLS
jgi:heat shock protein HtpX